MNEMTKGRSPFYPGQPVPIELFVGRSGEIERIMTRGVGQVALGKPMFFFVTGEYGIGKSSIASYVQALAELKSGLHAIYAPLPGASDLNGMAAGLLEATVRSGVFHPSRGERIRNFLSKYVSGQEVAGFKLNLDAIKQDAPNLTLHFAVLSFLEEVFNRLKDIGVNGIFLILDEINGLAADPGFAQFIKALADANSQAFSREPLPLLLMLCGIEQRRQEMIRNHEPVGRIFDVVDVAALPDDKVKEFFLKAFSSIGMSVEERALHELSYWSAGFPRIMHLIGDAAFWRDDDGVVDEEDAFSAVVTAAEEVGRKLVTPQVYDALMSKDYRVILTRIGEMSPQSISFTKKDIVSKLNEVQKKKLPNFLQKMKSLKVLRSGETRGEYVFTSRIVRLYIWLRLYAESRPQGRA